MKVLCLLVCLALARFSAGNIFRGTHQLDNTIRPQEYIDQLQYQRSTQSSEESRDPRPYELRDQATRRHNKHNHRHTSESREQNIEEQRRFKDQEQSPRQVYKSQDQIQDRRIKSQDISWESYPSQKQQSQEDTRYYNEEPISRRATQKRYDPTSEEKYYNLRSQDESTLEKRLAKKYAKIQEAQRKVVRSSLMSSSSESNSRERDNSNEEPMKYGTPKSLSVINKVKLPYGDVIEWNGIKMAVGVESEVDKEEIEKIFKDAYDTMKHVSEEEKMKYHQKYEMAAQSVYNNAYLNTTELLKKYQYAVEEHTIKTPDGYYLTMFRILPKKRSRDVQKRPVVFLMHGLLGSSDDWLLMGPEKSLAYLLSDAGCDVWLGNARGNKYSNSHVIKNRAQPEFWKFSVDEIALLDLPTMIDYTLKTTNQEKITYIGYDLGTTAFFALAATRPEYNDKIIMMHALAPMVYMSHVRSPLLRMIAPTSVFAERLTPFLGKGEFLPTKEFIQTVGGDMLKNEIGCRNISSNVNFVMSGVNVENIEVTLMPVIMRHLPAGASARLVKHFAQAVASHDFRKYDYGLKINEKVYGSNQPPSYKMTKVSVPVTLYSSEEDWLVHPNDVDRLAKELPTVDTVKIQDQRFGHMDFQFSKKAPEVVYQRLINSIEKSYSY